MEEPYAIAVNQQSNVYVTGSSVSASDDFDCVTIRYNSNGVQQWLQRYNSRPGYCDRAIAIDDTLIINNTVDAEDRGDLGVPGAYHLAQNYPNPFHPSTTVNYELPTNNHVRLRVFDVLGREVTALVNEVQEAGFNSIHMGCDRNASGVYFYRLQAGGFSATRKLVVVQWRSLTILEVEVKMSAFARHPSGKLRVRRLLGLLLLTTLAATAAAQWVQQGPKLVGTGAAGNAGQGISVSISSDGKTAIMGGQLDDAGRGAAWVFARSNGVWSQQGPKLTGGPVFGWFGRSVAISSDGNTAIVGAPKDNGLGAAWVFTRNDSVWTLQGTKLVGTGAGGTAPFFGGSVAISEDGNTAIVGGYTDSLGGSWTGAAWIFTRNGGAWTQQGPKLVGSGGVGNSTQGTSVSISSDGNTAIVGGESDDQGTGAVWVFTRSGGVWSQQGPKLVGTGAVGAAAQGRSVSLSADGNTAVVGGNLDASGRGAAWVFTRNAGVWSQQGQKLVGTGVVGNPQQGNAVSISADGNTAIVGAPLDSVFTGATWVFKRTGGSWHQQGLKLVGTGGGSFPLHGISVALSSDAKTAIVGGQGGSGGSWIFIDTSPFLTRPQPGERWLGGNVDTIRWTGGRPNQFVNIQLSTDSGATYTAIDYAIPADSGKYIWLVPDSLTTRAKIRLLDTATNDTLAASDTFKIKRYSLTRINRFGQYEEFSPVKHGWSFANADSNYWPARWWRQIDYLTGIDRHTGDPYDPMFSENPVNALPFHFVDWPVFVDVFGRSACYWFFTDSYREASVDRWKGVKTPWNGSCFGVAQSALLYFHYREQFRQRHPSVPLTDSLASVGAMTDSIRLIMNRYYAMQFGKLKRDHDINNLGTTPRQTLQAVRQMWANENPNDDAGLRFVDPAGSGGHAVIPFRLQRSQTNPNQFWLFVCNSNNPQSMNDAILIDSLANTWQEFTGFGWVQGTTLMYIYPPAVSFFAPSVFADGATSSGLSDANILGGGRIEFGLPRRSDVRITASNGDSIGVSGGNAFNSIQDATPITLDTGYPQPPLAYDLPSGTYRIRVTSPVDSVIVVSSRTDSLSITYSRRGATQGQRDELWYSGALGVKNLDAAQKTFNLQMLASSQSSDRTTNINDIAIGQNDSVSAGVDVLARPKLTNYGPAKTYQMKLRHSSEQGLRRFESATLNVPAQSAHIIAPRWDSLTTTTVRIYVDLGNNGTIDDTLIVNNTLDVEDRGDLSVPREYHLGQNYPNPFNPTTTINYQLPTSGHVTLKVFDILGRKVATLVDEMQDAGYKAVQFDASNLASGVYFYRLTTGNYVATRKFIVAK